MTAQRWRFFLLSRSHKKLVLLKRQHFAWSGEKLIASGTSFWYLLRHLLHCHIRPEEVFTHSLFFSIGRKTEQTLFTRSKETTNETRLHWKRSLSVYAEICWAAPRNSTAHCPSYARPMPVQRPQRLEGINGMGRSNRGWQTAQHNTRSAPPADCAKWSETCDIAKHQTLVFCCC